MPHETSLPSAVASHCPLLLPRRKGAQTRPLFEADYKRLSAIHAARQALDRERLPARKQARAKVHRGLREAFISKKIPLAATFARRHLAAGLDLADLTQAALMGLCEAVDRWRPEASGGGFATYALVWMRYRIQRHMRREACLIRVDEATHRLAVQLQTLSRAKPTDTWQEIALSAGLSEERVVETMRAPTRLFQASGSQYLETHRDSFARSSTNPGDVEDALIACIDAGLSPSAVLAGSAAIAGKPQTKRPAVDDARGRAKRSRKAVVQRPRGER